MEYPARCFRGILREDWVNRNKIVDIQAIRFDDSEIHVGWQEASVTWDDAQEALEVVRLQRNKDEQIQFKGGIGVLDTSDLLDMRRLPIFRSHFNFEKRDVPGNKYHGNLLWNKQAEDVLHKRVRIHLANLIKDVIPPAKDPAASQ